MKEIFYNSQFVTLISDINHHVIQIVITDFQNTRIFRFVLQQLPTKIEFKKISPPIRSKYSLVVKLGRMWRRNNRQTLSQKYFLGLKVPQNGRFYKTQNRAQTPSVQNKYCFLQYISGRIFHTYYNISLHHTETHTGITTSYPVSYRKPRGLIE